MEKEIYEQPEDFAAYPLNAVAISSMLWWRPIRSCFTSSRRSDTSHSPGGDNYVSDIDIENAITQRRVQMSLR
ncbi:hypothetical protein X759_35735 [Mesorhizobium sp. LSHC420B00]|nr:hypothetical protein X759_35735 [Mesorhizobium sp. LSHC420B00]